MKIVCKCGTIVTEGEVKHRTKKSQAGNIHNKKIFICKYLPKGSIIKGGSNDPEKWTGICSSCDKRRRKA